MDSEKEVEEPVQATVLSRLWPEAPQWLEAPVAHLLVKTPKRSPDSAAQVVDWILQTIAP